MRWRGPTQNDRRDGACVPTTSVEPCPNIHVNKKGEGPKSGRGNVCSRLSWFVYLVSPLRVSIHILPPSSGRELATGRKIAIKKIKVGQFKDGLDMSAVREVKYLRELHHPNVIEVRVFFALQTSSPTPRHSKCLISLSLSFHPFKLLDVFSSKTNLNLVLEFLDTDLEMIIKERSLVFLPADIKSWMAMTFRGLEFCHRNFILHRVRVSSPEPSALSRINSLT